ncbi:MAG: winged helix-turn-helix domain-containing protein, partial [Rubrobacteraceae bacterium]|nr:winged helix-turn-helix domain-containing protein [Rubrobacteraceae bacterium]
MRTGTNLLKVKDYNQRLVLEIIRLGDGASRVEIAERTGLTAQTVSNIVRRLLSEGVIEEVGKGRSRGGGKPRVLLRLRPGAGYAVGVQIDRDEVRV